MLNHFMYFPSEKPEKRNCKSQEWKKEKKNAKYKERDFPGGAVDKNLPANGEDMDSISEDPTYHRGTKPSHRATKPMYYNY